MTKTDSVEKPQKRYINLHEMQSYESLGKKYKNILFRIIEWYQHDTINGSTKEIIIIDTLL